MAKVLLLGGAFDPVHVGHEALAQLALAEMQERQGFEQLWFLPCYSDAFGQKNMVHWKHRVAMLERTIAYHGDIRFHLCLHEIEMANEAGTYAVVKSIMREYPDHEFFYLIGSDQAGSMRSWRSSRNLVKTIPFVIVNRRGLQTKFWGVSWYRRFPHIYIDRKPTEDPISSTKIRSDIAENGQIWWNGNYPDLNHVVQKYIRDNRLYGHEGENK